MRLNQDKKITDIINQIRAGAVGVMPTDTVYGLVGQALNKQSAKRIKKLKNRDKKPLIVLISKLKEIEKFGLKINQANREVIKKLWPGPISIVFNGLPKSFHYLSGGKKSLAFRLPQDKKLRDCLAKTGPLIATSANPRGLSPAQTIAEAKKYFGSQVDFYLSAGYKMPLIPSMVIEIKRGKVVILRQGIKPINL